MDYSTFSTEQLLGIYERLQRTVKKHKNTPRIVCQFYYGITSELLKRSLNDERNQ